jgi:hypothetical protein
MTKPVLGAPTRFWLRLATSVVLLLVAANFIAQWWYWEYRAPALGLRPDAPDLLIARLALLWAGATIAAAIAVFDFIGTMPRLARLAIGCAIAAGVLGAIPFLVPLWTHS